MIIPAALAIAEVCSALKQPTAAEEAAVTLAAEVRRLQQELVFAQPLFSRRELESKLVTRDLQVATLREQLRLAESKRDLHAAAREELTPLVQHLLTALESAILDLPFESQTELDLAMLAVRTKIG